MLTAPLAPLCWRSGAQLAALYAQGAGGIACYVGKPNELMNFADVEAHGAPARSFAASRASSAQIREEHEAPELVPARQASLPVFIYVLGAD